MSKNSWRIMWVIGMFDLPTGTREARKRYTRFRNHLLQRGFGQLQYSVYIRHCATFSNAKALVDKVGPTTPPEGHVIFFYLTDKQYGMTREFFGSRRAKKRPDVMAQIEMF